MFTKLTLISHSVISSYPYGISLNSPFHPSQHPLDRTLQRQTRPNLVLDHPVTVNPSPFVQSGYRVNPGFVLVGKEYFRKPQFFKSLNVNRQPLRHAVVPV
jgi:hypothetical protein